MSRLSRLIVCTAVVALTLPGATGAKGPLAEPEEGPDPRGLTISGAGVASVVAPTRRTEATIQAAVLRARPRALARAVGMARERAAALAATAGLTLGEIVAVSDRRPEVESGFVSFPRHCVPVGPARRVRCTVPLYAVAHVRVTFATAETSQANATGRAVVASEAARATVRPFDRRRSASIRRGLLAAQIAAAPAALRAAQSSAATAAAAAGMRVGALFAIAEVRRPFEEITQGSFGPGKFCGLNIRRIYRRDPERGRPTLVRRVREWRCFFPSETTVAVRVTYLPG